MLSKNVKYWLGYSFDQFSQKEDITPLYNVEESLENTIQEWNSECDEGNEIFRENDVYQILGVAKLFYNEVGYITKNILRAMIAQN